MKKTILGTVVCLGALLGMASRPAAAQTMGTLKVNLPVAATVGGVTLPAGEYTVRNLQANVLQISSFNGKSVDAIVTPVDAPKHNASNPSKVVLKQTEQGYKIQSIWVEGQDAGYEFLSAE